MRVQVTQEVTCVACTDSDTDSTVRRKLDSTMDGLLRCFLLLAVPILAKAGSGINHDDTCHEVVMTSDPNSGETTYKKMAYGDEITKVFEKPYSEIPRSTCIFNNNYGYEGNELWVKSPCSARFMVCYSHGRNPYVPACESTDEDDDTVIKCHVGLGITIQRIDRVDLRSHSALCKASVSYGFNNPAGVDEESYVWVTRGCRANFQLALEGRTGLVRDLAVKHSGVFD